MSRRLLVLCIVVVLSAVVIGIMTKPQAAEKPNVVIMLRELDIVFFQLLVVGAERGFTDYELDGKVIAPRNGTAEEQLEMLEEVLKQKPDILAIDAIDLPTLLPILNEFTLEGIPVLLLGADQPWDGKTAYIGTDNYELGRKAAAFIGVHLQPGDEVAIISGSLDQQPILQRVEGAIAQFELTGLKVVTVIEDIPNERDPIMEAMQAVLDEFPNVKGVYGTNDIIALHALEASWDYGLDIPITGSGGEIKMLEYVEEGLIPGLVAQNPYDIGYLTAKASSDLLNGMPISDRIDTGVDIIIKENVRHRIKFYYDLELE